MRVRVAVALIYLAILSYSGAVFAQEVKTCVQPTKTEVSSLFERWNSSLKTKLPEKVTENYAENAFLLPTISNVPRTNRETIRDYFEYFLKGEPVGKIDMRVIKTGCNYAIDTGIYTFTLKREGKTVTVPARYTFTYEYKNGKWLISSHHSSGMPETVSK